MDWLLVDYWPFWLGGLAFATLVVGMWLIEHRSLGVSGCYTQILARESAESLAFRDKAANDEDAVRDAMLQATLEEFGQEAVDAFLAEMEEEEAEAPRPATVSATPPLPYTVHLGFLAMLAVGGALGAIVSGSWEIRTTLGAAHESLTGGGTTSFIVLCLGGVLVGFGTRMSGGCTSGHGLTGCSRLQVASLLATGSFFGTAIAVSFLLRGLL